MWGTLEVPTKELLESKAKELCDLVLKTDYESMLDNGTIFNMYKDMYNHLYTALEDAGAIVEYHNYLSKNKESQ